MNRFRLFDYLRPLLGLWPCPHRVRRQRHAIRGSGWRRRLFDVHGLTSYLSQSDYQALDAHLGTIE